MLIQGQTNFVPPHLIIREGISSWLVSGRVTSLCLSVGYLTVERSLWQTSRYKDFQERELRVREGTSSVREGTSSVKSLGSSLESSQCF